jgi:hypothetical protein
LNVLILRPFLSVINSLFLVELLLAGSCLLDLIFFLSSDINYFCSSVFSNPEDLPIEDGAN